MKKVILDCDPGHDDAVAIMLAGLHKDIELLGITTVAGNSYLENTTRNALIISEMANIDVKVYPGASKPILRDQIVAHDIHGYSGLEGANLPEPKENASDIHAVDFMADAIRKNFGEVTLVATGPLTNVALFALKYPDLVKGIKEFVFMGGGIAFGNATPVAEFNIYVDPEAADITLGMDVPKVMAPLDMTHQAAITKEEVQKLKDSGSRVLNVVADLMIFFMKTYKKIFGIDGAPLHDPTTIAYLIDPDMFEWEDLNVSVELKGEITYGQTVVDVWKTTGRKPNVRVLKKIDRDKFFELLLDTLLKLS